MFDCSPMKKALAMAREAASVGEVPVGAVITDAQGEIVSVQRNHMQQHADPSAHAEMLALREACSRYGRRLPSGFSVWVTLEPCPMCAQALSFAGISNVYFGAYDIKGGGVTHGARIYEQSSCFHRPDVYGGIMESACAALLKVFFAERR